MCTQLQKQIVNGPQKNSSVLQTAIAMKKQKLWIATQKKSTQ